jgi:LysM repeat protein
VVRRGDNLSVISRRIGTTVRTLMKINGLRRGRIHPGQRLKFYPRTTRAQAVSKKRSLASKSPKKKRSPRRAKAKR